MSEPQIILIALVVLLILSAIPVTATFAMYIGLFLLLIAWMSAYQTGGLQSLLNELFSKGGNP